MGNKKKTFSQSPSEQVEDNTMHIISESFKRNALSCCNCSDNKEHLNPSYHSQNCAYFQHAVNSINK